MLMMLTIAMAWSCDGGLTAGPTLGCLTETSACIGACSGEGSALRLDVIDGEGRIAWSAEKKPQASSGFCIQWDVVGLDPATPYTYVISDSDAVGQYCASGSFMTQSPSQARVPSSIAFASCANEDPGSAAVWKRMQLRSVDAVVLLGDTPYIDTTDLEKQRSRYRAFASVESFASLVRNTPLYSTWDDHDYGANDTDGRLPGKENSRKAFLEHRPTQQAGAGDEGIYTRFRCGDIDVFLLDTRWFAGTEHSPFDDAKPGLLGAEQWKWFRTALASSTATFKVIATGMIFNDAVRPNKTDYWGNYPYERDALFELIGQLKVDGVVLVGGDIHRHRIVRHDAKDVVGYDLMEFISSPVHDSIIESANAPHPGLLMDLGVGHIYLELDAQIGADGVPYLVSRYVAADGKIMDERIIQLTDLMSSGGE